MNRPLVLAATCTAFAALAILSAEESDGLLVANPVSQLGARIAEGKVTLQHDGGRRGYLMSLLEALRIDPASQMLVFSKTSLQMDYISPTNPRALFFNDESSVGFVPGGHLLELATFDANQGVVFYTLPTSASEPLKMERKDRDCASCHSSRTGMQMVIESNYPMENGYPFIALGTIMPKPVDHRTPIEERWGGWYVTGTHGKVRHMGNSLPRDDFHPLELVGPQNITTLPARVDASKYPLPTSDIVALMVFEHQMYVTNLVSKVNYLYRRGLDRSEGGPAALEELVGALFFAKEAKITDPIRGVSDFTKHFAARGPADQQGRSLRQFDLDKRLFRYPFSYMVYSPIFDALVEPAKQQVIARVREVLAGRGGPAYAYLDADTRTAITDILRDTKPAVVAN